MKIPVFVSCPTQLNKGQQSAKKAILRRLDELGMEPRTLGTTDYPSDFPLKEVLVIAKHCCGGVILGFEQLCVTAGTWKSGTAVEKHIVGPTSLPTPWNQLETGILFALGRPLLVFRERVLTGGVFDPGVTDVFIHKMPIGRLSRADANALREVFLNWQRKVRALYYGD